MQPHLRPALHTVRAYPVFAFYAIVTVAYAVFIGLMVIQMASGVEIFLPGQFGQMQHGAVASHRVHDIAYGLLVMTMILGVLVQFGRTTKNVAAMVMALLPFMALLLAAVLTDGPIDVLLRRNPLYMVAALAAVTALLHPNGTSFFRSFRLSGLSWTMLALVGVAAAPLLSFASTNIRLQGSVADDHANLGHYGFMAAFAFTVIAVGLLASLRPDGWTFAAFVTGALPAVLAVTSMLYPNAASSLATGWALAAFAWGIAFITAAIRSQRGRPDGGLTRPPTIADHTTDDTRVIN